MKRKNLIRLSMVCLIITFIFLTSCKIIEINKSKINYKTDDNSDISKDIEIIDIKDEEETINYSDYTGQIDNETKTAEVVEDVTREDQFYKTPKAHWTHMPVTYFIINEKECGSYETNKIKKGFNKIQEKTNNIVNFKKVDSSNEADIDIKCSFIKNCYDKKIDIEDFGDYYTKREWETICNHKKGIADIKKYDRNKILKAEIELIGLHGFAETNFKGMSGFYIGSCGHSTTEIHEILHTFYYGHVNDSNSIMYYSEDGVGYSVQKAGECLGSKKEIDDWIIKDLIETYSEK